MSASLLQRFRLLHRKIASVLFVFFFFISITGILLGWKSIFTTTVYENKQVKPTISLKEWLPIDSLEGFATNTINEKTDNHFKHADRIELRPAKGYISFSYKKNYAIQVDGATGNAIVIEQKNGGFIQDIHDGAIVDGWLTNKLGLSKIIYSTVMGFALLVLTITGFYLWFKPKQIKQAKQTFTRKVPET